VLSDGLEVDCAEPYYRIFICTLHMIAKQLCGQYIYIYLCILHIHLISSLPFEIDMLTRHYVVFVNIF